MKKAECGEEGAIEMLEKERLAMEGVDGDVFSAALGNGRAGGTEKEEGDGVSTFIAFRRSRGAMGLTT